MLITNIIGEYIMAFILAIIYIITFIIAISWPILLPVALIIGVFKLTVKEHVPAPAETISTPRTPSSNYIDELAILRGVVKILLGVVVAVIALSVYGIIELKMWLTRQWRKRI
jgi:small-conductance mechanosensitive channel